MRKTQTQEPKAKPADSLLKTSKKKKDIELTEKELGNVTGGSVSGTFEKKVDIKWTTS
jgi:hypothetical protein